MKILKVSKEEARRFLIRYHHLDGTQPLLGMDGVMEYVKKVGCIQFDPLNIVGRNADLVLQSRISDYKSNMLEQLLYEKRSLIDGWDKVMSIYAVDDWHYFHLVREQRGKEAISTLQYRNSTETMNADVVIEALAKNGAMQPKQIGTGSVVSGTWGHRNIYSATLDYLFHVGKVGVSKKINVNKVYDLIENLLPKHILNHSAPFETEHDFFKWYVYRWIGSIGMLWNRNGGGWLGTLMPNKKTRQHILDELVDDGSVTIIEVEDIVDRFYARSNDISIFETLAESKHKDMKFIAPLDNLIWDRDMISKLFGFEYTWEVYIPVAKRKYGYYVLPVLYGDCFIARFEPEKSATHMYVKNWWWEDGVDVSDGLIDSAMRAMERFSVFLGKKQGVHESVRDKLDAKMQKGKNSN